MPQRAFPHDTLDKHLRWRRMMMEMTIIHHHHPPPHPTTKPHDRHCSLCYIRSLYLIFVLRYTSPSSPALSLSLSLLGASGERQRELECNKSRGQRRMGRAQHAHIISPLLFSLLDRLHSLGFSCCSSLAPLTSGSRCHPRQRLAAWPRL